MVVNEISNLQLVVMLCTFTISLFILICIIASESKNDRKRNCIIGIPIVFLCLIITIVIGFV